MGLQYPRSRPLVADRDLDELGLSGTAVPVDRPGVSMARHRPRSGFQPDPRKPDSASDRLTGLIDGLRRPGRGGADHEIDIEATVGAAPLNRGVRRHSLDEVG